MDFVLIFGRPGPIHIEIGTGKGTFLLNEARAEPDVNFLGIERANKYYRYAVDRMGRWNIRNVRIIRADAASFLANFVPDSSVDCFHIYFPDPWPKRRHHKRRFFNEANLDQLLHCLKRQGRLKVATDHAGYFQQIQELIRARCSDIQQTEFLRAAGAAPSELTGTNYERKYIRDQRRIQTVAVRKI